MGQLGWIVPKTQFVHEMFKGKIFLNRTDCENANLLAEGVTVSFLVYKDNQGLGAMNVTVTVGAPEATPDPGPMKPKAKAGAAGPEVLQAKPKASADSTKL